MDSLDNLRSSVMRFRERERSAQERNAVSGVLWIRASRWIASYGRRGDRLMAIHHPIRSAGRGLPLDTHEGPNCEFRFDRGGPRHDLVLTRQIHDAANFVRESTSTDAGSR